MDFIETDTKKIPIKDIRSQNGLKREIVELVRAMPSPDRPCETTDFLMGLQFILDQHGKVKTIEFPEEKLYYKWSKKWSFDKNDSFVFYGPNNSGYTHDLNKAGKYSEDELSKCESIIESKEDFHKAMNCENYHPVYAIPVDKIDVIGRKQTQLIRY